MKPAGLIFDFDGVLIESEASGNRQLADYLTGLGRPITPAESMARFMGRAGTDFLAEVEAFLGHAIPDDFHAVREAENARVLAEGIEEVAGAVAFVRALPADLPKAIASSSSTAWIRRHLDHIGLADVFGDHIYSGREHVTRGKPAPDLYWHAAEAIGVPVERCAVIEDSPVGATGAVASGAYVVGLCAGTHCDAGHAARLKAIGVRATAATFDEVVRLLELE